jgi:hypothetical protein
MADRFYFPRPSGRRRWHAGVLERDEARRMAANFAKLPD